MIEIGINAKRVELRAPYHPVLPLRSKAIGGEWMGAKIGWTFPVAQERAVRALCMDIWSVDGSPEAFSNTVDLRITVDEHTPVRSVFLAYHNPIYLVGREIAASLTNRKAARPGKGIRFLTGRPRCVETPSVWSTVIPNGCVFVVRDVPLRAVNRFHQAVAKAGYIEIESEG